MAEYDFDIVYRPEKQHTNADALSRYPVTVSAVSANEQWLYPAFKNDFKKQQGKDSLTTTLLEWVTKATRPKSEQIKAQVVSSAITGLGSTNSQFKTEYSEFSIQSRTVRIGGSVLSYLSKQSKKF